MLNLIRLLVCKMNSKDKLIPYIHGSVMILGFMIMLILAIVSIIDSHATDLVSAIPLSILGASLFISGYISLAQQKK